jgi:hypothetical protein
VEFLFPLYLYGICSAMFLSLVLGFLVRCWISGPLVGFLVRCCLLVELLRNRELISGQLHKVSSSRLSFLADPVLVWSSRRSVPLF